VIGEALKAHHTRLPDFFMTSLLVVNESLNKIWVPLKTPQTRLSDFLTMSLLIVNEREKKARVTKYQGFLEVPI
jgi:hypothetical protein